MCEIPFKEFQKSPACEEYIINCNGVRRASDLSSKTNRTVASDHINCEDYVQGNECGNAVGADTVLPKQVLFSFCPITVQEKKY